MDVKFENKNVCRHIDITTCNHASVDTTDVPAPALELLDKAAADDKSDPTKWCQCCKIHPPHSENQKNGNDITEDDFYNPKETGLRAKTVGIDKPSGLPKYKMAKGPPSKGEAKQIETALKRVADMRAGPCKDQVPPGDPPASNECNKYYKSQQKRKKISTFCITPQQMTIIPTSLLTGKAKNDSAPCSTERWRLSGRTKRYPSHDGRVQKESPRSGESQGQVDAITKDKLPTNGIIL